MHMVYSVIYARVLHKKTVKRECVLKGLSKSSACCKVNGSCNGSCSCIDSDKSDRQENIYIYTHMYIDKVAHTHMHTCNYELLVEQLAKYC